MTYSILKWRKYDIRFLCEVSLLVEFYAEYLFAVMFYFVDDFRVKEKMKDLTHR